MKISRNRTTAATIALFLMLTIAATLVTLPAANAHTPPISIPTYAYLAISPNPVGVGESVFLVMWLHSAPLTALGLAGDRWRDFKITVTKPNGDNETVGTWDSDPTGSAFTLYTPDQVGTYKFVFNYPGQVLSLYGPNGLPGSYSDFINDTYLASSATANLTVQQEPIPKIPEYPLPTEYWTRPIEGQNTAWASIASNWLGGSQLGIPYNLWQQGGIAPESPHIMWTKQIEFGGIVGGTNAIPDVGFYSGGSYEGRFFNVIIMYGRLYFMLPLGHSSGDRSSGLGYVCVDLRTGEEMWLSDEIGIPYFGLYTSADRPTMEGQLFDYESQNQHGVVGGIIWQIAGSTWIAYDAFSGHWLYNMTSVPSGTEVYTPKGEIVRYVLNYNSKARSGWLALWNNTQHNVGLELAQTGTTTEAYQWRPIGKTVNMSTAYSWNVTISADLSGLSAPAIVQVLPGDLILGRSTAIAAAVGVKYTPDPYTLWAISDKPESRGTLLWIRNYTAPAGNITRTLASYPVDPVNRVFIMNDIETMSWSGYSIDDGSLKWGPVGGAERAFSYYGGGEGGGGRGVIAYGNLYVQGYGGELLCYSTKNGTLLWNYNNTNSGDETPWGNYPIFIGAIADGKVYAFNNEHSPNYPLYKGERVRCINATTGKELWTLMGWSGQQGGPGSSTMVEAEGFLTYYNYYDNQIYCIGKGPSATTVDAPMTAITAGDSVVMQGTVTDIAAGTKQKEQAARFPNGVPAVSDASMSAWMEYVYMQKPLPANATGVQVTIDAVDPNGNFIHIGTVTSDTSGLFHYAWKTPDVPGEYTVIATFPGSGAYYASYAETAMYVQEAPPTPTPPPAAAPLPPFDLYILIATVVIVIAVAIATILMLRKRP